MFNVLPVSFMLNVISKISGGFRVKKAKIVLIGINGFGKSIARHLQKCENIDLIGIHDINTEALMEVSRLFNLTPIKTLDEVLQSDCDGVVLEVPNHVHLALAKACAEAGKHVLVEKPITNTVEEAEEMIRICRENNVILQVGHSTRFCPRYRKAKELLDSNEIGKVVMIEANSSSEKGKSQTPESWRYYRDKCPGGPMLQLGIHLIDTIFYLTGCVYRSVTGYFTEGFSDTDNVDAGAIVMKLENDALAYVGSSYVSPHTHEMVIYGDRGKMEIYTDKIVITSAEGKKEINVEEKPGDSFISQFESFARCILEKSEPEVDGRMGLINLKAILDVLN